MTSNDREQKHFVDRHLPSPTHMEFVAARDRILDELRAAPPHLQKSRLADPPLALSEPGGRVEGWLRTAVPLAAAAALIVIVATVSFRSEWLATVEAADGSQYTLKPDTVLSAKDPSGLRLTLKDGSTIEMRSASELSLTKATGGIDIRLLAGDIIVKGVAQRDRHLAVQTRDMSVAVAGTTSLVKTVEDGSRVAAIAGTVRVNEGGFETVLHPGEQFTTSPTLTARPLRDDIAWSRNAGAHLAILDSFAMGIAQTRGSLTPLARQVDVPGAQTPTPAAANAQAGGPEFEEASIRECDPDNLPPSLIGARGGGANSVMMTPGRYYALCVTPATLIRGAYGFRGAEIDALLPGGALPAPRGGRAPIRGRFGVVGSIGQESGLRVRGGPDWVRKQQYTIEAVADSATDTATMSGPMLRALFERRFTLKTHVETEQTLAYNLVVAPGGLKIKPVPAGSCEVPPQAGSPPTTVRRADGTVQVSNTILVNGMPRPIPRPLSELRRAAKPSCAVLQGPNGPNWVILAGEATFDGLSGLTQFLRAFLDKGIGVTDKTGITDKFNWDLEFLVDANVRVGSASGIIPVADANVPRAPTIFDALEQQLGLRLEATKVPREYLVIDSIERPGPN